MKTTLILLLISFACGCGEKAELQTGTFIESGDTYNRIFVGRLAGVHVTDTNIRNIIIIGDFSSEEESKLIYHNYQILIKWDWKYFNTQSGEILKRNLQKLTAEMPNSETLLKQRFEFIHNKLLHHFVNDINAWYEKQKPISL